MAKTAGNITIKLDNTDSVRHAVRQQIMAALEECGLTA